MTAIIIHPFRALTLAVFLVSSVGQSVLAQVNDDFADRIVLDGILPVSATGSNVGASLELDEPDDTGVFTGSSVWWEWTAPSSGTVQIDTFGSDFETVLAVYIGVDLAALRKITSSGYPADYRQSQSRVRFSAVKGTTYQVAVGGREIEYDDGFPIDEGNIELNVSMAPSGPPNDNFADRIVLPSVVSTSIVGSNVNASVEQDEPAHLDNFYPPRTVWWEWTAPSTGLVEIDTIVSDFDTVLAVYTGMALGILDEIAVSSVSLQFSAVVGTTYQIAVADDAGSEGKFALTIRMPPALPVLPALPEPPNDNFADRITLPSELPTSTGRSNLKGSVEQDEPAHAGSSPKSSIWWEWTAPSSGVVEIDVDSSYFRLRSFLAVYTGMTLGTLSEIDSNGRQVRFFAVEGTTYQIAVGCGEWNDQEDCDDEKDIELTISMAPPGPPNDNFADRIALPSELPTSTGGSSMNASVEQDEPAHAKSSIWWEWTAPSSGAVEIDIDGSDSSMSLTVYAGMDLTTLSKIVNDVVSDEDRGSQIRFFAAEGTTYQIAVGCGEWNDWEDCEDEGDIAFTISMAEPGPSNDNFADRITLPSVLPTSISGSNVNASVEQDEPHYGRSSVWWEWTAPSSGVVRIDMAGSYYDPDITVYTGMTLDALSTNTLSTIAPRDHASDEKAFLAVIGTTYQIAVDNYAGREGRLELEISMDPPGPPNDHFGDRITLPSELPISTDGSNVNASAELDEPDHAGSSPERSVWWEWTAPSSGEVYIDTFGSDFESVVAVYTGTDLAALSEIADNDSYGYGPKYVHFSAVKGTTYQIAVDDIFWYSEKGDIALTISPAPPGPPNDNFADRIALPSELPTSADGSNLGASLERNEPLDDFHLYSAESTVWWEWTASSSGEVYIDTFGSDFDTVLVVYTGTDLATLNELASDAADGHDLSQVHFAAVKGTTYQIVVDGSFGSDGGNIALTISSAPPGPPNDNFADRIALPSVLPISTDGSNVNATVERDEPDHAGVSAISTVWWEWTAPSSGTVQIDTFGSDFHTQHAVYTGTDLAALREIASNDGFGVDSSQVRFAAVKGTTYQIAVDGSDGGNIALTISPTPPGPPNDNFEDRIVLPSELPISTDGSNVNASVELDEPDHAGYFPRSTVWWEWTAPSSGEVYIDTSGSDFSTKLAVYTGTDLAALDEIDSASRRVRFSAVMGTTYQIAVYGGFLSGGNITLTISMVLEPPHDNNNFEDRIALPSGLPIYASGSNVGASGELGEPNHGAFNSRSVWWEWTAPLSGTVEIDTSGSDFVSVVAVYTGTDLAALSENLGDDVWWNKDDDSYWEVDVERELVRFSAVKGTTYQIAVDGIYIAVPDFPYPQGNITLNMRMVPPGPPNDNFADRITLPSELPTSAQGDNVHATGEVAEPYHGLYATGNSVWWEWTASFSGTVFINIFGSDFDMKLSVFSGTELATLDSNWIEDVDIYVEEDNHISFSAVSGTTYQIAVMGLDYAEGTVSFQLEPGFSPSAAR